MRILLLDMVDSIHFCIVIVFSILIDHVMEQEWLDPYSKLKYIFISSSISSELLHVHYRILIHVLTHFYMHFLIKMFFVKQ